MKNKINFKLTAVLVSLFIGFLLIVLGNKNKYCLSFGFVVLGFAIGMYATFKRKDLDDAINNTNAQIDEEEEQVVIYELNKHKKNLKKQKNFGCLMFFLCAALLIVLGFIGIF